MAESSGCDDLIIVFDLKVKGNIYKAITGKKIGTFIRG